MKQRLKQRAQAPGSRFPKRRHANYVAFIRDHDCCVKTHAGYPSQCFAMPGRNKIEPAHLKTQGSGGDDVGNIVPLCPVHHDRQEGKTRTFEATHRLDLYAVAAELKREWEQVSGASEAG